MVSTNYFGTVSMIPELAKMDFFSGDDDVTSLDLPKIYFDGMRDLYEEDYAYDWLMDSVIMAKDQYVIKFTESTTNEVLLKDMNGESAWLNGQVALMLGVDITEQEDIRVLKEYFVEVYDLEKSEKKRGKVVFEEPSPMSEYEFSEFGKFYLAGSC